MLIHQNSTRQKFSIPGLDHWALAGFRDGLTGIDVSLKKLAVGGATPVHYHECEEVVVVLAGRGRARMNEVESEVFGPETTIVVPTGAVHQFENMGNDELVLLCAFSATPCGVFRPDGSEIPVPWGPGAGK